MTLARYEPNEDLKMFGCSKEYLDKLAEQWLKNHDDVSMLIAGMLSDTQEVLSHYPEQATQYLNRAKYLIFNYLEKD